MGTIALEATGVPDQLMVVRVDELRPHPGLLKHGLLTAVHKISALANRGESAFTDPLTVTHEGLILDGYARWTLARKKGVQNLSCLVRRLSEQQALVELLRAQHRTSHLNDFNRILLALELDEHFRELARRNQQTGGRDKALSDLTAAQRVDVRAEIARAAGVSSGNVNHAKFLLENAAPEVVTALKDGKVKIGRAQGWLRHSSTRGRQELKEFRITHAMRATSRALLAAHPSPTSGRSRESVEAILGKLTAEEQQTLLEALLAAVSGVVVSQALNVVGASHAA